MSIYLLMNDFQLKFSKHTSICGIDVSVFLLNKADTATAFTKIKAALNLIQQYDPRRMAYLKRDVKRILVAGAPDFQGMWHQKHAMCELTESFVLSPDTTPAILASTLAHEAMHARLMCWGFGYEEHIRVRIEAVCIKASMAFARRLPLSEMTSRGVIMWRSEQLLNRDAVLWSNEGRSDASLHALREIGCPEWLIQILMRIRAARLHWSQRKSQPSDH